MGEVKCLRMEKGLLFATALLTSSSPGSSNIKVTLLFFFSMSFPMMISMNRFLITSSIMAECVLLFRVISTIASPTIFAYCFGSARAIVFCFVMTKRFKFFAILLLIKFP